MGSFLNKQLKNVSGFNLNFSLKFVVRSSLLSSGTRLFFSFFFDKEKVIYYEWVSKDWMPG